VEDKVDPGVTALVEARVVVEGDRVKVEVISQVQVQEAIAFVLSVVISSLTRSASDVWISPVRSVGQK